MNWYQLSDNVTLDPMPQVAFTDSNGIASFNLTVLSANNGSNLALEFTSVAALSASWSYTVMRYLDASSIRCCHHVT